MIVSSKGSGCDRGLILGTHPGFAWRGWGKTRKTSVKRVNIAAQIRTEYFRNVSQKRHWLSQLPPWVRVQLELHGNTAFGEDFGNPVSWSVVTLSQLNTSQTVRTLHQFNLTRYFQYSSKHKCAEHTFPVSHSFILFSDKQFGHWYHLVTKFSVINNRRIILWVTRAEKTKVKRF